MEKLWLDPIPEGLREMASDALEKRNVGGFLMLADNMRGLELIWWNVAILRELGIYEEALLHAYRGVRTNCHHFSVRELAYLWSKADRAKLRQAGSPLPGPGPYAAFRGVGGNGPARRVRGFSWTASKEQAIWFANRAATFGLADPAVYVAEFLEADVLAYTNEREEQEFLVMPDKLQPKRITTIGDCRGTDL